MTRLVYLGMVFGLMIGFAFPRETTAQCETYTITWPTQHPVICLGAQQLNGTTDPHAAFTLTVKDGGIPKSGVQVKIDFTDCTSYLKLCQTQNPGTNFDCNAHTVWKNTDTQGHVTFAIAGWALPRGSGCTGFGGKAKVFLCGATFPTVSAVAACYDQDGANGVDLVDVSAVDADRVCYSNNPSNYNPRSDFDGNGVVELLDVSADYGDVTAQQSLCNDPYHHCLYSCGFTCP